MEVNSNGCTAMVQDSDSGSDDAVSKRLNPHVIVPVSFQIEII